MTGKNRTNARLLKIIVFYFILSLILPSLLLAGELDDFEEEATRREDTDDKNHEVSSSKRSGHDGMGEIHAEDSECNSFFDCFSRITVDLLFFGGKYSYYQRRTNEDLAGTPVLPNVSLDTDYQHVGSDIYSINNRVEIGYGPFGFQYKELRYFEKEPKDRLKIYQLNYLHRMTDGESFRMDIGIGTVTMEGNQSSSGLSLLTPLYVFLPKKCTVFLRPNWGWINGNSLQDYKLGVLISRKYMSIQGGYRLVKSGRETLDGPFIGFNLHY